MDALAAPKSTELRDELDRYLGSDPEYVVDAVRWWHDRRADYPQLSRMAMDYLIIPRKCSSSYSHLQGDFSHLV